MPLRQKPDREQDIRVDLAWFGLIEAGIGGPARPAHESPGRATPVGNGAPARHTEPRLGRRLFTCTWIVSSDLMGSPATTLATHVMLVTTSLSVSNYRRFNFFDLKLTTRITQKFIQNITFLSWFAYKLFKNIFAQFF